MSQNSKLAGKVALVTGAGQGIGAAIAQELAAQGAIVVLSDINAQTVEVTASAIAEAGATTLALQHDAADEADWKRVVDEAVSRFGTIDILVNNAGIIDLTPWTDMTVELFDRIQRVNVKGPFLGARAVVPVMTKGGGGSIINISSMNGMVAHMPGLSAYATSKGAVRMFTKALALDVVDLNIRVNSIHPGVIASPFVQTYLDDPATRAMALSRTAMKRPGEPGEIAKLVAFVASDDASFMTGSEVVADGGFLSF